MKTMSQARVRQIRNLGRALPVAIVFAATAATCGVGAEQRSPAFWDGAPPAIRLPTNYPGFCLDLDCGDGSRAAEIARRTDCFVFALAKDEADCARAREMLAQAGFLGTRATAMAGSLKALPFPRCYMNLIVAGENLDALDLRELFRVLNPNGLAVIGGGKSEAAKIKAALDAAGIKGYKIVGNYATFPGKMPEGLDEWTHVTPRLDNIMNTRDPNMRPPFRTQWILNAPTMPSQFAVISDGRVVYRNGLNHYAWDSFNGTLLWQNSVRDKNYERCALVEGVFYTPEGDAIVAMDAATGERKREYRITGVDHEANWAYQTTGWSEGRYVPAKMAAEIRGAYWWWLGVENGRLYGMAQTPTTKTNNIHGTGDLIFALDLRSGDTIWKRQPKAPVYGPSVALSDGRLFFFTLSRPGGDEIPKRQDEGGRSSVHALDAATGKELWTGDLPRVEWPRIQHQPAAGVWKGRYFVWCALSDKGQKGTRAFDTETGALVKEYPKVHSMGIGNAMPLLFVGDRVYANSGSVYGGAFWANKYRCYDLASGNETNVVFDQYTKSGCGPGNATPTCIFNGGQGINAFDLETGKAWSHYMLRSACYKGPIIGGGILLTLPVACQCPYPQKAPMALAPAGKDWLPPDALTNISARTVAGPALRAPLVDSAGEEWTHYRGNPGHTGETGTVPKMPFALGWERKLGGLLTAPAFGNGLVFVASGDGAVWGLDRRSGEIRWKYLCGGGIRVTPAYGKGRVLVGSNDGWVYCLEAKSGQLAWRFRAAPEECFINRGGAAPFAGWKPKNEVATDGLLASVWPATAGVIVEGDRVYCAAGWFPWDGTYIYALDLASGKPAWGKQIGYPANMAVAPQGVLTAGTDILIVPCPTRAVQGYRKTDGERLPWHIEPKGMKGFIGHQKPTGGNVVASGTVFYIGDSEYSLVDGDNGWHYGKTLGGADFQNRKHTVVTAAGVAPVLGRDLIVGDGVAYERVRFCEALRREPAKARTMKAWSVPLWPGQTNTTGLALAGDVLLASGKDEVVAFEAQTDGKELSRTKVPGAILRNSLAVSGGQVFVVTEAGSVCCLTGTTPMR